MHMGIGLILWIRALVQNTKIDIHALTCTCLHFALYAQEGTQHSLGSRITYHFLSKQTFSLLSTYRRINVGQAVTSFYNVLFLVCLEPSTIEREQYTLCSETSRAFLLGAEMFRVIYKWYTFTTVKNLFISCFRDWSPTVNTLSIERGFEASGSKTSLLWGLRLSGSSTSRKPLPL